MDDKKLNKNVNEELSDETLDEVAGGAAPGGSALRPVVPKTVDTVKGSVQAAAERLMVNGAGNSAMGVSSAEKIVGSTESNNEAMGFKNPLNNTSAI